MDNLVIEQAPAVTGPTVQLPARPSAPAPAPIPAPQPPTPSQTEWYDDLMIPVLLIAGAVAMVTLPRFMVFIVIAIGVVGLLLSVLSSITARRIVAAAALAVAIGFFFSRRLFWAPLVIALIATLFFKKRRRRIW